MAREIVRVVASSDDQYAQHLGVMVCSLIENKSEGYDLHIYIIDGGITEINKKNLLTFEHKPSIRISFLNIDSDIYKDYRVDRYITAATYYRLSIPEFLDQDIEKIIYLDCDLVVLADIYDLWRIDLASCSIAAVKVDNIGQKHKHRLGLPPDAFYFNAGVLLMDLAKWRAEGIGTKVRDFIIKNEPEHHDQDGLNSVLYGQCLFLDRRWNKMTILIDPFNRSDDYVNDIKKDYLGSPGIIHFASDYKPWNYASVDPLRHVYFEYLKKTPWANFKYQDINLLSMTIRFLFDHCPGWLLRIIQKVFSLLKSVKNAIVRYFKKASIQCS